MQEYFYFKRHGTNKNVMGLAKDAVKLFVDNTRISLSRISS